jgi:hypothetical protein
LRKFLLECRKGTCEPDDALRQKELPDGMIRNI